MKKLAVLLIGFCAACANSPAPAGGAAGPSDVGGGAVADSAVVGGGDASADAALAADGTGGSDAAAGADSSAATGQDAEDADPGPADSAAAEVAGSDAAGADSGGSDTVASDTVASDVGPAACSSNQLSDLFQKKIKPLVTQGQPTTCNQCHLSGVDLGLFVQDTPCKSMACMQAKGIVDFANPAQSQVLAWIAKAKPESKLITAAVQQAEYNAFLEWITWSASCQTAACGAIADPCQSGPPLPPPPKPMLGSCDESALVAAFEAKVYKWRYRCDHCHSPTGKDAQKSFGGFKPTPFLHPDLGTLGAKFTMYNLVGVQAIDVANPTNSTLLTKPLAEAAGGVWHGGGDKFQDTSDQSYVDFLSWIKTFAKCKGP